MSLQIVCTICPKPSCLAPIYVRPQCSDFFGFLLQARFIDPVLFPRDQSTVMTDDLCLYELHSSVSNFTASGDSCFGPSANIWCFRKRERSVLAPKDWCYIAQHPRMLQTCPSEGELTWSVVHHLLPSITLFCEVHSS